MTSTAIFICRDPRDPGWGLGSLLDMGGAMVLMGWRQTPEPVDGGVPSDIAAVIARALTCVARVTFLSAEMDAPSNVWSPRGADFVRSMGKAGLAGRIHNLIDRIPPHAALVSTRQPETALRLFDDGGFPWWLQSQVALLSNPEAAPPDLEGAALLSLVDDAWATHAADFSGAGVLGILRPGVDGDVAGLLSLTTSFEVAMLAALESESLQAGFEWAVLSEDAFRERLATSLQCS